MFSINRETFRLYVAFPSVIFLSCVLMSVGAYIIFMYKSFKPVNFPWFVWVAISVASVCFLTCIGTSFFIVRHIQQYRLVKADETEL